MLPEKLDLTETGCHSAWRGALVTQVLVALSKLVEAALAVGERVIAAFGTLEVVVVPPTLNWMVALFKKILTGTEPTPLTFKTLLNQI